MRNFFILIAFSFSSILVAQTVNNQQNTAQRILSGNINTKGSNSRWLRRNYIQ